VPNFVKIDHSAVEILRFFNMVTVHHLGFVWGIFGPPRTVRGGVYHCAKFGYDRCSSFDNMKVSIFGYLLKKPDHTPKNWGFGTM